MASDLDKFFPSKYLRASDIEKPMDATITNAYEEKVQSQSGVDVRPCVDLEGIEKPLILNKTNFLSISKIAGSENLRDWSGTVISIYTITGEFFGEVQDAIRIQVPQGSKVDQAFGASKTEERKEFQP